ncbi:putative bifunctional diguanylate cyclase/phosphodiesterase [Stutzerimonas azotifigens]|uniref:Bifunctional diguanylate cyclase/phosphodiesterase n=1 Tax=Stutzerimonas azotifigens TaxID=291995 RepID=A0ABR5YYW8_9GAMM|nr:bifunctional diguanylate cyclase/phosphodiesterase [Stutzerimonas azotifigens]MBA1273135.1 bifunctional diguanylate cyclase/phosphodiesterase [Stutzerimonas azotifigens]
MSASALSLRLVILAEQPEWIARLRNCLHAAGNALPLIVAPDWETASLRLDPAGHYLLFSTPACRPSATGGWPLVLLLDKEPSTPPDGAADWLVSRKLNPDVLSRCLRYALERIRLQATVQRLAEHDPLTGIANRQGFQALLSAHLANDGGEGLALGHLDLDNFRHVNDSLGHQAGDRLILQVVARLRSQLAAGDVVARLGGDEFALLLDTRRQTDRDEEVADRIVEALAEPYWLDGESMMIGCSLGIADAGGADDADSLMVQAHIAMQQAKIRQGCTWYRYDPLINRGARSLSDLESELRRALRRDELELHYQPRLSMEDNRIVGLEALVRWKHPERGLLLPNEFIPMAEESGLIVPLGYWVISRALRDMQCLQGGGHNDLHMAVNLSFRQFQDSQLLPTLSRLIDERGVDPGWLEFELTETAVMRRSDQVRQTMQALRDLGVRFSLDDFGTGFSSFVHLNNLPISLLKIDKSFVGGMDGRKHNRKLVQAMINMAHELELEIVAEGVETGEQMGVLRSFGASQVQGFLVSKPLPFSELQGFLGNGRRVGQSN